MRKKRMGGVKRTQRNEEECKKAEIGPVGTAAADNNGHHLRLLRSCSGIGFLFSVSYIAT
jgi:hypothetical protein